MADLKLFFNKKIARYLESLIKLYSSKKINWKSKSSKSFDPVTKFDLKIEKELKKIILKKFPKSNFIGEETKSKISNKKKTNNFTWVVDPIDGTKNFILGAPTWSNLIGLNINGSPTYGLAFFPILKKYYFSDGKKTFIYDNFKIKKRIKSSNTNNILQSKIVTNTIHTLKYKSLFKFFANHKNLFRVSSIDALNYCLLAEGKIDIIVESGLKKVDIDPLIPIIKNSGGVITTWKGKEDFTTGNIIVSSNRILHTKMLSRLNKIL